MRVVMFGAIGAYAAAVSRTIAPHVELLGCVARRPIEGPVAYWLRHAINRERIDGFACEVLTTGAWSEEPLFHKLRVRWRPDLILVAGFPRKLPAGLLGGAATLGAVNLHPALLPRDRGPHPLFWAFHRGDQSTGVTLHHVTDVLDGGDILAQRPHPIRAGIDGMRLFEELGVVGGKLLVEQLPMLASKTWHMVPQPLDPGAWARKPTHQDFELRAADWTAERLFRFVRGVRAWGTPWACLADDYYYFADCTDYAPGARIPGEFVVVGETLTLAVLDGTVTLRITRK